VLVGCVCTVGGCVIAGGCAGGEGGCVGDVCGCVGAVEVCDGGVGKLTCCNVISLWGWTYDGEHSATLGILSLRQEAK
jgi:hypothetical protein